MTYPQLNDNVDCLASAFSIIGLKKGDRVATLLPTSIQFVMADYAISRAGLIHVPASILEPIDTLEHKFLESRPRALICFEDQAALGLELKEKTKFDFLMLTDINDYAGINGEGRTHDAVSRENGILFLSDLIASTQIKPPPIEFDVDRDIETLLFTGGTTGLPKGCMLTHRNIYANSIQNLHALGQAGLLLRGKVSVLLGLPFYHSFGHLIMHTMTLYGFNQILVPDPRDTAGMVRMIKKHYPIMQIGVPAQFMKLAGEELDGISMLCISGSAPLPKNTQIHFEQKSGGGIMEGYGLSEMSPITHLNTSILMRIFGKKQSLIINNILKIRGVKFLLGCPVYLMGTRFFGKIFATILHNLIKSSVEKKTRISAEKRGTIGVPLPDTEIRIIDAETGELLSLNDLLSGRTGEMCLNGPQRMLGYWPEPGSGIDKDGFIHTGDVVRMDDRGYFYIADRIKDMINVSGYKVYSREIDDLLSSHPQIELAATVGVPDAQKEGSERVVVYIQPKFQFRGIISEDEILDYLKIKLAKYAVPKFIRFIDEMPLTDVQKINKKKIREMAIMEFGLV
jgi:acyl-CoA synthetase (AMP-forming)/AMP-acid ligase II